MTLKIIQRGRKTVDSVDIALHLGPNDLSSFDFGTCPPAGRRQYSAEDPFGHQSTFTETVAEVAPEEWGGATVEG